MGEGGRPGVEESGRVKRLAHHLFSRVVSRVWLSISAREEKRSYDPGRIYRLLSRIWLFFWLRDRLGSADDRTPHRQ